MCIRIKKTYIFMRTKNQIHPALVSCLCPASLAIIPSMPIQTIPHFIKNISFPFSDDVTGRFHIHRDLGEEYLCETVCETATRWQ